MASFINLNGDCNDPSVQQSLKEAFSASTGTPVDQIEFHCGKSSVVRRRKRSNSKTVSLRYPIFNKWDKEKFKKDNVRVELDKLKLQMENKDAPNFIKKMNSISNWQNIHKRIEGNSVRTEIEGKAFERCVEQGEGDAGRNSPIETRCGIYFFYQFILRWFYPVFKVIITKTNLHQQIRELFL